MSSSPPSQWTIYAPASGSARTFTYEIAQRFVDLNVSCARALTLSPADLEAKVEATVIAARRCFEAVNECNSWPAATVDSFDWRCITLAVRVLDRTLAALGVAAFKAAEAVNDSFRPYSNVMKHGLNILQATLETLNTASSRVAGKVLNGSGTLDEVGTISDPLNVYGMSSQNSDQAEFVCSGIIADCVDLVTDLCAVSTLSPTNIASCSYEWESSFTTIQLYDRSCWDIGDVASIDIMAVKLAIPESTVAGMADSGKLLAFRWFDGERMFPTSQIDPATGLPYAELAHLLETIDFTKCPAIALASWLGQFDRSQNMERWEMLRSGGGLAQIWLQLRGRGVMTNVELLADGTKVWGAQMVRAPTVVDVRSVYSQKMFAELEGWAPHFESLLAGTASTPTAKPLYRIVSRDHTPFFFSQVASKGGGRFDLPAATTHGTCYCADDVYGAITEVYGQMLLVDVQAILVRRICQLHNFIDIDQLLDINDQNVATVLKLQADFLSTMDRPSTQNFAATVATVGFRGIVHALKTNYGGRGYAIFGKSGCTQPEDSGLGSWSVDISKVGDDTSFWQWVKDEQTNKAPDAVLVMPNQLPLKTLQPR